MNSNISIEKMAAYLQGQLSAEETAKIDHRLKEDPLLAEALGELDEYIRRGGDLQNAQKIRDSIKSKYWPAEVESRKKPYLAFAAAIIILLIGAFSIYYLTSTKEDSLYSDYFSPYEDVITTRSSDMSAVMKDGLAAYNSEEFEQAASIFNDIHSDSEYYPIAQFYLAQSLLANDETEEAIAVLKTIAIDNTNIFHTHAQWYLALAYLKKGEESKANNYLNQLIDNTAAYNHQKAKDLKAAILSR